MGGSSLPSAKGVYGGLGVPAATNVPGARSFATIWSDGNGVWLLGGNGYDANGDGGWLNDFWKFDSSSHQWTWMGGESTVPDPTAEQPGIYGTLGTPAAGNRPGTRLAAASWMDSSSNLWLFGGQGSDANGDIGYLNDLWVFNPSLQQWAWMGGSSTFGVDCGLDTVCVRPGIHSALTSAGGANMPGGRVAAAAWSDGNGHFWLFGGFGEGSNGLLGELNDLWEFDVSTKGWTWIKGSTTVVDLNAGRAGVYGTKGTAAPGNFPGGRYSAVSWIDGSGKLWLFGGNGTDAAGVNNAVLNDLWKFDPSSSVWTWMGGSSAVTCAAGEGSLCGVAGVYGTSGTGAAANVPGGRFLASGWTDGNGNFWLFGGEGIDADGTWGRLNDLWEFNTSSGQWSWMSGSKTLPGFEESQPGDYGTLGVPAATNVPPGRASSMGWTDKAGNLWLFGGTYAAGQYNDLWEYQPFRVTATPQFSIASGNYSAIQRVTISDASAGAVIHYTVDGTTPNKASTIYSGPITVSSALTIQAIAIAPDSNPSEVASATYTVQIPTFTLSGTAVSVVAGAATGNVSTITVTPANGFTGNVTLTATVTSGPANAVGTPALSFGSTGAVTLSGASAGTASLVISTTPATTTGCKTTTALRRGSHGYLPDAVVAFVILLGVPWRRKSWRAWAGVLGLLVVFAGGMVACSNVVLRECPTVVVPGTTTGAYTITVTGTSGATVATGTVILTVQ